MPSLIITFLVVALLIGLFVYQTTKNKSAASQESFITLLEQVLSNGIKHYNPNSAAEFLKLAIHENDILFMEFIDESGNTLAKVGQPDIQQGGVSTRAIKSAKDDGQQLIGEIRYQFSSTSLK
ncbi:MAG: hypothetical protein ABF326_11875, partial [Arenicellales bacterium]